MSSQFSHFCTADDRGFLCFTMRRPFPFENCCFPWGDLNPDLIHGPIAQTTTSGKNRYRLSILHTQSLIKCGQWGCGCGIRYKSSAVADMGDHLATIYMGRKLRACPFRGVGVGPHLTQCCLGRGLPPYQVASSSIQLFGHNRHMPKIGGLFRGNWVPI